MTKWILFCFVALAGCAKSDWSYDAISTYHPEFDSKRLTHRPEGGFPPWKIELLYAEDVLEMFVSLTQHRFSSLPQDPSHVIASLQIEGEEDLLQEKAFLFEGNMKLKLPDLLTSALIQALQEGKKVSILIDTMQETLGPESFNKNFHKLMKKGYDWEIHLQTPLK